jgi:hypothetical protein
LAFVLKFDSKVSLRSSVAANFSTFGSHRRIFGRKLAFLGKAQRYPCSIKTPIQTAFKPGKTGCKPNTRPMKGIIFTELLDMVEQQFGYEMVDELLTQTPLPSGGVYTAIGTYDHTEIVALVVNMSQKSDIPIPDLLYAFGQYLFKSFTKNYAHFIHRAANAFDFLESIHNYIHVEVRKLYPDAQLPVFQTHRPDAQTLVMIYESERKMAPLAHGLIDGCLTHFNEKAEVAIRPLSDDGSSVSFEIRKYE